MTSQKRFRQHHENNSAARFRDLPPRFKRQKSSSSPKPNSEAAANNQENEIVSLAEPLTMPHSPARPLPSNWNSLTVQVSPYQDSKPSLNSWHSSPERGSLQPVLSQVENRFFNFSHMTEACVSADGFFVPYSEYNTPPPSPWGPEMRTATAMTDVIHPSNHWSVTPGIFNNQRQQKYARKILGRGENIGHGLDMAQVDFPKSGWMTNSESQHNSPPTEGVPTSLGSPISLSRIVVDNNVDPHCSKSDLRKVDHSDPDIRTIEMLRELERVADEKEREDEAGSGVDRKNLVSHHLRMLMCAVDRYTESVDDPVPAAAAQSPNEEMASENKSSKSREWVGENGAWSSQKVTPNHAVPEQLSYNEQAWKMVKQKTHNGSTPRKAFSVPSKHLRQPQEIATSNGQVQGSRIQHGLHHRVPQWQESHSPSNSSTRTSPVSYYSSSPMKKTASPSSQVPSTQSSLPIGPSNSTQQRNYTPPPSRVISPPSRIPSPPSTFLRTISPSCFSAKPEIITDPSCWGSLTPSPSPWVSPITPPPSSYNVNSHCTGDAAHNQPTTHIAPISAPTRSMSTPPAQPATFALPEAKGWDLWSSPSFISHIYSQPQDPRCL